MLYKKRRRDRILNMIKNKKTILEDVDNNSIDDYDFKEDNILEIPGFYYDHNKKRYFPKVNTHTKTFSEFYKESNEIALNIAKRKNITKPLDNLKDNSIFYILKYSSKLRKNELINNKNLEEAIRKNAINNTKLYELKKKSNMNKYEFFKFNDKNYLLNFDSSDDNYIIIDEILNDNRFIYTRSIKQMRLPDIYFSCVKVVKNYFILVHSYTIILVQIKDLFQNTKYSINAYDFKNEFKLKMYPQTFNWPIIKLVENNEFIILFNKCIFFVYLSLNKYNGNKIIDSFRDFTNDIKTIDLKKKYYFTKYSFSDFYYNHHKLIMAEISGDIIVYDNNFNLITKINSHSSSPILNLSFVNNQLYSIRCNSQIEIIDLIFYTNKVFHQSLLPKNYNLNMNIYIDNEFICTMNEEGDYEIYLRGTFLKKFAKSEFDLKNNIYCLIQEDKIYSIIK